MPELSIIVPCYNHGRFLPEALDSVAAQTFRDLEVLVVDDGSTDPVTLAALSSLDRPGVRVHRVSHGGKAAAVNSGIGESSGTNVLVLDADDRIAPAYAEKALSVLRDRPEVGIVYCEAEFFGAKRGRWDLPPFELRHMLARNLIFSSAFFRREDWQRVGGFSEDVWVEDYDFWLKLLELGREVHRIPEVLFYYRKHRDHHSKSRSLPRRRGIEDQDRIYRNHRALYAEHVDVLIDRIRDLKLELEARREGSWRKRLRRWLGRRGPFDRREPDG